ncbi:DUF92 domain-containing protein [Cnuella takakiae]|nr:DUF92 domain-containing protein [Cnuella takakiae]OLY93266.1 hypothetical protein BUE76_16255 [Cnuella takakiae]
MLPLILLLIVLGLVWYTRKLTVAGTLVAGVLAGVIFKGTGWTGIVLLGAFFMLGTGVTLWGKKDKVIAGLSDAESSRRTAGQVLANGGVAGLLGLAAWMFPVYQPALLLMMAGSFSAAAADTLASELGVLYGRRFYNINSFKPETKGLDGVVSLEGTLLGMAGSLIIALLLGAVGGVWQVGALLLAGTAGNLLDSWLGATLERKGRLSNNLVNAANTLAGAAVMWLYTLL